MLLELDRLDLREDARDVPVQSVVFRLFKPEVQAAIRAVGQAVFYSWDRTNYNDIYPAGHNGNDHANGHLDKSLSS
jgi:hypothetical protein